MYVLPIERFSFFKSHHLCKIILFEKVSLCKNRMTKDKIPTQIEKKILCIKNSTITFYICNNSLSTKYIWQHLLLVIDSMKDIPKYFVIISHTEGIENIGQHNWYQYLVINEIKILQQYWIKMWIYL